MNPEIKANWVAKLRSGEYQQSRNVLRTKDNKYCCLGVLCEIAVANGVIPEPHLTAPRGSYCYDGMTAGLPDSVMLWSEIPEYLGSLVEVLKLERNLASLNDHGVDFDGIADIIEERL